VSEQTSSKFLFSFVEQDQLNWLKAVSSVTIMHPNDRGFGLQIGSSFVLFISVN